MATLVGAFDDEVSLLNSLTVNIHALFAAFFKPTGKRTKVLIEHMAFPSDHYAVQSHLSLHGLSEDSLLIVKPRPCSETMETADVIKAIKNHSQELCLIWLPGVQYYTGQRLDIPRITEAAHSFGIPIGWDLAHSVGNVPLSLHDWDVDFAAWCSYKYLNSGPGGVGGMFVHRRLSTKPGLMGWWGHRLETRFLMNNQMELSEGVKGFRISNPSLFLCASLKGSLDMFDEAGMESVRNKSLHLTRLLEALLDHYFGAREIFMVITPRDTDQRGAHLSLLFSSGEEMIRIFGELTKMGVVADKRMPNVIRVAPCPIYNNCEDVYRLVSALRKAVDSR